MAHALNINTYAGYAVHAAQPGIFARLHQVVADHLAYRAIHNELAAFSDRDLADIGLSRETIRDVARAAVYGN